MLPMRSLPAPSAHGTLAVNRRGALSFHDTDHGDGRSPAQGGALAWLDELLRAEGMTTPPARSGCTATRACWATPSSR
jgi:hypothetical protein